MTAFAFLQEQASHGTFEWDRLINVGVTAALCVWLVTQGIPGMQKAVNAERESDRAARAKEKDAERAARAEEQRAEREARANEQKRFLEAIAAQENAHSESERENRQATQQLVGLLQDMRGTEHGHRTRGPD